MLQQLILCFIGFCAGIIVAGGVSGLLIGLSIVPRYAGITHTADQIFLYEDLTLLGTVAGTVVTLFPIRIPLGPFFLAVCGVFFGIFLGGWILALAEIAKVFPVFARRLKLSQGLSPVIISIASRPDRSTMPENGYCLPPEAGYPAPDLKETPYQPVRIFLFYRPSRNRKNIACKGSCR